MTLLQNKVAIVTGCSSGIGLATTKLFIDFGARVFGIDISHFPSPSPLPASRSAGFHFHQTDLLQPTSVADAVASCIAKFRPNIDVLANVAGIMDNYECADSITDATWERVMGINVTVPMRLMRAVLVQGGMKERRSGSLQVPPPYLLIITSWIRSPG
ncbi:hypothetical protein OIDMADRAFT_178883 [Oidiodendron maius Zn]|uniref:Uncharacterized protein n=1 Tax=Oidiodendron maius (strain Zn) TaxID=913774 RepID=A0A0C3HJJ5_OIDMZ|nr:hypothetical protein OIDMADRAFT_178883 [Oidiodendron maius Zn]